MASRTTSSNKALKIWGEKVHERDNDRCQVCGATPAQAHHIVGKRNFKLRFELHNGILLCSKHHVMDSKFSAHGTPTLFGEWFESKYPERHQFLRDHVNEIWDKNYDNILEKLGG